MKLSDLQQKLYKKKPDDIEKRKMADDTYDPSKEERPKDDFEKFESDVLEKQTVENLDVIQKKAKGRKFFMIGIITVGILIGIIGVIIVYFRFIGSAFLEERVVVFVEGPDEVKSAEKSTYKVTISNSNRVALYDVELRLSYPENMVIEDSPVIQKTGFNNSKIDVGTIAAREKKEFDVSFEPFGPRDRRVFLNASILYQPKNFHSDFEKSTQKSIVIKSSPIELTIIPVKEAASGEAVSIDMIIKNESANSYENLELRVGYPEGFTFDRSEPETVREKSIWEISNIQAREQRKITIFGRLQGMEESLKRFNAVLGEVRGSDMLVYTENEGIIKIVPSRVQIFIEPTDETIYPGKEIKYVTTFKNTSSVPLRDLILYQYIESPLLVKEQTKVDNGHYDSEKGVVVWKASDIPELKNLQPGQEGSVKSSVMLTDIVPMNNENDKNFAVKTYAEIESLDVDSPIWQNKRIRSPEEETKVHSKLILDASIAYNDGELPNTGPIPPIVDQETTFTVRFSLMNTSNDLKNAIVRTSMPSGIVWKDSYLPENAGIEINTRSNEIKWIIGTVNAGVGFIEPVRTLAFQIGIKPSANQVGNGREVRLLNEFKITALDSFTEEEIEYNFKEISLPEVSDIEAKVLPKSGVSE